MLESGQTCQWFMGLSLVDSLCGVVVALIERHDGFNVAAKIGQQASRFAEVMIELGSEKVATH